VSPWHIISALSAFILLATAGRSLLGIIHPGFVGACAVVLNGSLCNHIIFPCCLRVRVLRIRVYILLLLCSVMVGSDVCEL
jgi:energy-converting hydrogenase Eha subunit B